jgi:hypothetical protein
MSDEMEYYTGHDGMESQYKSTTVDPTAEYYEKKTYSVRFNGLQEIAHVSEEDGDFFEKKCDEIMEFLPSGEGLRFFELISRALQGEYNLGWYDAGGD